MLDRLDPLGDRCGGIVLPAELRDLGREGPHHHLVVALVSAELVGLW